jgi:hypothetical protein
MKTLRFDLSFGVLWYCLWSTLLLIAVSDSLAWHSVFAGSFGVLVSVGVAGVATFVLMVDSGFLTRKLKQFATVVLLLFGMSQVVGWVTAMATTAPFRGFDFAAYYVASRLIAEEPRESPYGHAVGPDGRFVLPYNQMMHPGLQTPAARFHVPYAIPFIYPPLTAVLMKPLVRQPFYSAYVTWRWMCAVALCTSIILILNLGGAPIEPKLLLMAGVGSFSYYPARCDLLYGQIGCFILLFLTMSIWLLARKQRALSAVCYALATAIKLTPVLAIPVLAFHRKWMWLFAYSVALFAVIAFSIWQGGWAINRQFVTQVLPGLSCGLPIRTNVSVIAFVEQLFLGQVPSLEQGVTGLSGTACTISRCVAAGVYGLVLLRFWLGRRKGELIQEIALIALLAISVSPISWWHHYTVALLPLLYLWCKSQEGERTLLTVLVLVVGTNIVGFLQLLTSNHTAQVVLSAIVPLLTVTFIYAYSGQRKQTGKTSSPAPATSLPSPA